MVRIEVKDQENQHSPSYLGLLENGELRRRAALLREELRSCALCPRRCGVNRVDGERGFCRGGEKASVVSVCAHHGEEPALSGTRGAGTVFFASCTLGCIYCQNYQISRRPDLSATEMSSEGLCSHFLRLQEEGCHNLEWVTPTHFLPQALEALVLAVERGLRLPLVYNCGGYENVGILRLLDGIVDVYLPDLKYASNENARSLSGAADYVERAQAAIQEMWRQVGPVVLSPDGVARRGLIVRHLVLPEDLSGTRACLEFLSYEVGSGVSVSLMGQFDPPPLIRLPPSLQRPLSAEEYRHAEEALKGVGLRNGWVQDLSSRACFRPDFRSDEPFRGSRE